MASFFVLIPFNPFATYDLTLFLETPAVADLVSILIASPCPVTFNKLATTLQIWVEGVAPNQEPTTVINALPILTSLYVRSCGFWTVLPILSNI